MVVVNGIRYTKDDDNGSEKPFATGIAAMLERFLEERDEGSDTGYDGSDGSTVDDNTYYDPWGGTGTNPGGGGGGNNTGPGTPWQRSNGNLVVTPVAGKVTSIAYPDYTISFQEVTITTNDGRTITGYQVTEVIPAGGAPLSNIPDNFMSNCHGHAFGEGALWFHDPFDSSLRDPNFNEMAVFESLFDQQDPNRLYNQVDSSQAEFAAIWWTDKNTGERMMVHSAKVNSNGTFSQKNDYGTVTTNATFSELEAGHVPSNVYDLKSYIIVVTISFHRC